MLKLILGASRHLVNRRSAASFRSASFQPTARPLTQWVYSGAEAHDLGELVA